MNTVAAETHDQSLSLETRISFFGGVLFISILFLRWKLPLLSLSAIRIAVPILTCEFFGTKLRRRQGGPLKGKVLSNVSANKKQKTAGNNNNDVYFHYPPQYSAPLCRVSVSRISVPPSFIECRMRTVSGDFAFPRR